MRPLTSLSLFSGAGGLDYGLEAAGFVTGVCVELDSACCATLRRSRRQWPVIERDIFQVSSQEMLDATGRRAGEIDLLVGGPPCQPFSKAGYWARGDSLRLDDPRANTLSAYLRVLEDTLPRAFLLENVQGLAFSGKDEALGLLSAGIAAINARQGTRYSMAMKVVNAAEYGVPQLRERVFLVGARDGRTFEFPAATHADPNESTQTSIFSLPPYKTAWDALGDLEFQQSPRQAAPGTWQMRGKWADLLPSIPEGQNYLWHTSRGGGLPLFGWRRRFWTFLLKLAKNRPSWTLQAQPGPAVGPFHWTSRRLGPLELARLQTFPDDVVFVGPLAAIQKQVGNAVASLVTEVLGRAIREQLLGAGLPSSPLRLLPVRRTPTPPEEVVCPVPAAFRGLVGEHDAHPGTGKGHRASTRTAASSGTSVNAVPSKRSRSLRTGA
jgi:DNA (cytosine-5)-methyltransferase 1